MLTVIVDILALEDQGIIPPLLTFLHAQNVMENSQTRLIISSPCGSSWLTLESQEYSDVYPPFDKINQLLIKGIQDLRVSKISHNPISSALSLALCGLQNQDDPRILIISRQEDVPSEYIPVMNCIFAAQKSNISIDVLRYSSENSLFQSQASYLTHGCYYQTIIKKELIQVLFTIFIVPKGLRSDLILPNQSVTDLRPLCFCHKKTMDIGYVLNLHIVVLVGQNSRIKISCLSKDFLMRFNRFLLGNAVSESMPSIEFFASKPITPVSLEYLLELGTKNQLGVAQYVHHELPIRLARRIKAIQLLPFIVGINPHIRSIYELYHASFNSILSLPEPVDQASQELLAAKLDELTESHVNVIPILAKGFAECGKYMKKDSSQSFLDGMIQARIGIRLIAEHFLGLQYKHEHWVGVVNKYVSPEKMVHETSKFVTEICEMNYGRAPGIQLNGRLDTTIAYVPVHLEYIFTELLKNAMRATVEYSARTNRKSLPDLLVSIAQNESAVTLRIRDEGGGIDPKNMSHIWEYSWTTVDKGKSSESLLGDQSQQSFERGSGGPMAGLGFGLPISRIYARYFGGSLDIKSIPGHGCDVFLRIPNISVVSDQVKI